LPNFGYSTKSIMLMLRLTIICFLFLQNGIAQTKDIDWLRNINVNRNQHLDKGIYTLSQSVYSATLALPIGELAVGVLKKDKKIQLNALYSTISIIGAVGVSKLLKDQIERPRPYETYPFIQNYYIPDSYSMPSGHTTAAFVTATNLTLHYPKWYVAVPAFTYASAIGYSRMHLGVHYPSDVAAGVGIGMASAFVTHKLQHWLNKKR
jgi:membrane-associated phospholipid phosphatase